MMKKVYVCVMCNAEYEEVPGSSRCTKCGGLIFHVLRSPERLREFLNI